MKYELTIETQTSNTITVFPHTREGLIEAFNQVHIERSKTGFQFAKIVQFQTSLHGLNKARYDKLVEVGHNSGFSDQSHFIRTFKKYTGQTPSYYLTQMSSN